MEKDDFEKKSADGENYEKITQNAKSFICKLSIICGRLSTCDFFRDTVTCKVIVVLVSNTSTVLPAKSDSDGMFCLQLLSKTLTCTLHLSLCELIDHLCINPSPRIGLIHK